MPTTTILEAIATTATTTLAATSKPTDAPPPPPHDGGHGECRLMGSFALVVQAALGGLALLSLVYKRWRERPQRPIKIWFFDASKQVFGSVLVHIANVFMSMLTSGRFNMKPKTVVVNALLARAEDYVPNPCSFYLLNLAIDTTIGIPILLLLLKIIHGLASYTSYGQPPESILSGYYGNPPNAIWWLKQSILYFFGLMGMKLCVLVIFLVLPWISKVGDWALGWTAGNEKVQIAFVMMIFPLIMNAMQYYIIDSFIKRKVDHDALPTEDSGHSRNPFSEDEDFEAELMTGFETESEDEAPKKPIAKRKSQEEYDPHRDGESQTIVGSSRSHQVYGSSKAASQSSITPRTADQ
ncbi:unnamed protein product [Clonostachys rosea]|uniref:Vacuolar membrane protein n=1 Tax=Bionectria ochroleuca TaxID=29856 RepID=A0ABY6UZ33_BIOOC|nr:unnamed protein product [Clonostachys rosea]